MKVASIMTREVMTVGMDDPLRKARAIFKQAGFHHILVVEGQKLVGIISDRDLLAVNGYDAITLNKKVYEIMDKAHIAVDGETSIEKVGKLLWENNMHCLPVLSSEGVVEGVVTRKNILKFYSKDGNCY